MKRLKPDLPDAATLRARALEAERQAAEAERQAAAARAEAASALADGDAQGALNSRNRAAQHAAEAEAQRDLAGELRRRGDAAEATERLREYEAIRALADLAAREADAQIHAAVTTMAETLAGAQAQQRAAVEVCSRAAAAYRRLVPGTEAPPPPMLSDVLVTSGGLRGIIAFSQLPRFYLA
jgi:hypothetical protein